MAKVEVVYKEKTPVVWEPYATITVSKRELAGLYKLLGASHYKLVGGETYRQISKIIESLGFVGANNVRVTVPDLEIVTLDTQYGEV